MTISNYSELQSAVANWLNRTDLTARIVEFISLAEARLNRDLRLRVMETDNAVVTVASSRYVALPTGYLEPLALFIERTSGREALTFVPARMETNTATGVPIYWTVDGSNLAFDKPADQVYNLTFRMLQSFALSNSSTTNWLLTNYPDLYLAATLVEGFGYLMDDEALKWVARYGQTLAEVNAKENRARSMAQLSTELSTLLRFNKSFNINTGL